MGDMEERLSLGELPLHTKLQSSISGSVLLLSAWLRSVGIDRGLPKM